MSDKKINILYCSGVEGNSLYVESYRVFGPKPWGGGQTIEEWDVPEKEILTALGLDQITSQLNKANEDRENYLDALEKIDNWAKAYPLDVFPEPDLKKAHEVLMKAGMTLDAISANSMRHVITGVKDIVEKALKDSENG